LAFLSRHLRLLRAVPVLPHLLDAWLRAWTQLLHPARGAAIDALEAEVESWSTVTGHPHRFGGREWRMGKREIGHLHGNGVLDVPLPPEQAQRWIASGAAWEHHTLPGTGWVSLPVRGSADLESAIALIREAAGQRRSRRRTADR
ncbi:MAG: luciferase family protein, partial [Armatimonadota bacterium]